MNYKGYHKAKPDACYASWYVSDPCGHNNGENGIGMGLATTFVLVCSNFVISLLKNVIPKAVRLPCFIVIIAGFVTLIEFLMKGYIPELYSALGVFLSLITVNCIILAERSFCQQEQDIPVHT